MSSPSQSRSTEEAFVQSACFAWAGISSVRINPLLITVNSPCGRRLARTGSSLGALALFLDFSEEAQQTIENGERVRRRSRDVKVHWQDRIGPVVDFFMAKVRTA